MGYNRRVPETVTYRVPGMHCGHCEAAVKEELAEVEGVEAVDVDLDSKVVTVRGTRLSDDSLRAAIEAAGYDAA
jgi:copper chaperone CopZ